MYFPNLERLKTVLFQVQADPKLFHMGAWAGVKPKPDCGTTCCAAGWGALDPVLQDRGLMLHLIDESGEIIYFTSLDQIKKFDPIWAVEITLTYQGHLGFDAARHFFNVSDQAADYLFDPSYYEYDGEITPLMVIDRINEVIACEGNRPGEDG